MQDRISLIFLFSSPPFKDIFFLEHMHLVLHRFYCDYILYLPTTTMDCVPLTIFAMMAIQK